MKLSERCEEPKLIRARTVRVADLICVGDEYHDAAGERRVGWRLASRGDVYIVLNVRTYDRAIKIDTFPQQPYAWFPNDEYICLISARS